MRKSAAVVSRRLRRWGGRLATRWRCSFILTRADRDCSWCYTLVSSRCRWSPAGGANVRRAFRHFSLRNVAAWRSRTTRGACTLVSSPMSSRFPIGPDNTVLGVAQGAIVECVGCAIRVLTIRLAFCTRTRWQTVLSRHCAVLNKNNTVCVSSVRTLLRYVHVTSRVWQLACHFRLLVRKVNTRNAYDISGISWLWDISEISWWVVDL